MSATLCHATRLAYTPKRGVRNLDSGHRTRQPCGFFITPRQTSFNGSEGMGILEYHPPSITVLNLLAALFWASLPLQKTDRTPAMMARCTLFLPVRSAVHS